MKVLTETYGKSLLNIFQYYVDIAEKRRNKLLTSEKLKIKKESAAREAAGLIGVTATAAGNNTSMLSTLRNIAKYQKDLICYKEYVNFCHDFNLRSTALLTAIQVGEVFLNIVPGPHGTAYGALLMRPASTAAYSSDLIGGVGMNFDQFCKSILYMAYIAFRENSAKVTPGEKVIAQLLCLLMLPRCG